MTTDMKTSYIANFNCTFGEENKPMLDHFFDVIYPAFLHEPQKSESFFFKNVILTNLRGDFVLAGLIVKRTTLEVKSIMVDGELKRTNKVYPSDPYSYFLINLKNHRMLLAKNQKGSPTLTNFSTTARKILNSYIREYNKDKDTKLPSVNLNVVAIPFEESIESALKKVNKIKWVKLKFYPLNGDIIDKGVADALLESLSEVESKTANITYNTPKSKKGVAQLIKDTKGLMDPTIKAVDKNGGETTLKSSSFTETISIPLDESESLGENLNSLIGHGLNKNEFNELSTENEKIYNKYYSKLEEFVKKILRNK